LDKYRAVLNNPGPLEMKNADAGDGEIVVVHELGQIARKYAKEFFLGAGDQVVRFSFPAIQPQRITDMGTGIDVKKVGFFNAENTAYLDAIAYDALENRRGRMVAKQMARLLLKGQINYQAEKNFGPLAGLAANLVTAATETADTRSWTTLPQAFYISRARLAPGDYDIAVKTDGRVRQAKHVTVRKGQMILLRSWE
jgi:hypothetical protein